MNISLRNLWRSVTAVGISLILVALLMGLGQRNVQAQGSLYKKVSGVSGNLSSVGSDTLNNVMTLWAENFRRFYPGVNVQVEGKKVPVPRRRPSQQAHLSWDRCCGR